jgi:ketosteroid isomerase-like protein
MYKIGFAVAFLLLCSCSSEQDTKFEIEKIMQTQTNAWNARDIEGFMEPYWHSDSLRFMGKSGVTLGWKATLNRYKKNYQLDQMGQLHFDDLFYNEISSEAAWVDGRWTLYRSHDTLSGRFSLLWKKIDNKWQIIADHSS